MDDDIHFRNEERKKKTGLDGGVVVVNGGRKNSSGGKEGGEKMLRLAPIKAGGGGRRVFSLTPGSSGDRRLCMRMCVRVRVFMCVCILSQGSSVSISWGRGRTWEKALVARKKQPAILKQYQLRGNRQGDQSTTQSNKGKKNNRKKIKCNAAMRGGRKKKGQREGMKVRRRKIYLLFYSGEEDVEKAGEECEGER